MDISKIPSSVFGEGRYTLFVHISSAVWAILTGTSVEIFSAMRASVEYHSENYSAEHEQQTNKHKDITLDEHAAEGYDCANEQK